MKRPWIAFALSIALATAAGVCVYRFGSGAGEPTPATPAPQRQVWQSNGYGYILEMNGKAVDMYSSTKDSLVPFGKGHIEEDGSLYVDEILAHGQEGQKFWLGRFIDGVLTDHLGYAKTYRKVDRLPAVEYRGFSDDPVQNFEVFWQTYEENFSFFPIVDVDWHGLYRKYRTKVSSSTTEPELQNIFRDMIRQLNDGHSNLFGAEIFSSHSERPREKFYQSNLDRIRLNIRERYLAGQLKNTLDGRILYGRTGSGEGYIQLLEFDVPDPQQVDEALGAVVRDLKDCRNFIVDMRFNRGGEDFFGTKVAGLFADDRKRAYRKQVRTGTYEQFSEPASVYIDPAETRFAADRVVVLTSPLTVSAGETATLALRQLDQVTTIGETTAGYFSDMLLKMLPNQQLFSLSNERYTSDAGTNFEQLGLSPDEKITMTQADVDALRDPVMSRALALSKKTP